MIRPLSALLILTGLSVFCAPLWGQKANVVTLVDSTSINVSSEHYYTSYRYREMLLLNNKAADLTDIVLQMGPNAELLSFEYEICDMFGKAVCPKVKKSALKRVEYSRELATDDYRLVAEVTPPTFPVLVKLTTKIGFSGNIISYPVFMPQMLRDMSVAHAVYHISWPSDKVNILHKAVNLPQQLPKRVGNKSELTYVVDSLQPIPSMTFALPLEQQVPMVMFAPETFSYYGTKGSLADWCSFGQWHYQFVTDNPFLPDGVINDLNMLFATCHTPLEKVKAVRDYMGAHTRYVSLQLGIGGYRPMSPGEVWKFGYGDCKGLSNYMRAMLMQAGIDSRLVVVGTDEPRLLHDFANFQQMNHMFLEAFVPRVDGVDTLLIECTNPKVPVGYVHTGIAGHDVIEFTDQGGRLRTIAEYADTLNLEHTDIHFTLRPDASADVRIDSRHEYHRCQRYLGLLDSKEQELRTSLLSLYNLPNATAGAITLKDDSELGGTPRLRTHLEVACPKYANLTGRRLFVAVNPLRNPAILRVEAGDKSQPLYVELGYRDEMNICLNLPEGVTIESVPADVDLEEDFISFHQHFTRSDAQIVVSLRVDLRAGTYPAEARKRFAEIQQLISKAYAAKVVLLKK